MVLGSSLKVFCALSISLNGPSGPSSPLSLSRVLLEGQSTLLQVLALMEENPSTLYSTQSPRLVEITKTRNLGLNLENTRLALGHSLSRLLVLLRITVQDFCCSVSPVAECAHVATFLANEI